MSDAVNKPAHYNQGSIECIEAMKIVLTPEEFRGYLKGNVFKCLWREKNKNGNEDLRNGKSYFDWLIELVDESEQQKAADLQSLKDHPFGKLKKAHLNSDTIPEGYRKLNDSSEEPRQLGDLRWSVSQKRYVEITFEEIGYANRDNWAACRIISGEVTPEVTPEVKNPLGCSDGWRPNDNVSLAMQMAANSFGGKDGVFNAANFSNAMRQIAGVGCTLDGHVVATILGGRSDVEVLQGGSHYRYLFYESIGSSQKPAEPPKPTVEVTGEVEPPDGWRFLEVGEVICKGDMFFSKGHGWRGYDLSTGQKLSLTGRPSIRRNRFEVGEKVVDCRAEVAFTVQHFDKEHQIVFVDGVSKGIESKHFAPYIEETK